jgi:glyoxylase-like metal-dependent hydrolase (beta-lactamase superfamily II)
VAIVHQVIPVGVFQANCTILADDTSKTAVIIDPGDEPKRILDVVRDLGVRVTHLLHTHCHLDHITGTRAVREATGGSILIHPKDRFLYDGLKEQYASMVRLFGASLGDGEDALPANGKLAEGATIPLGKSKIKVLHTPGHTPGSCSFLLEAPDGPRLFTGDTLFAGSIGRTDLEGGDTELELESIKKRLMTLDPETPVFPGHGPSTRIGIEREQNPWLQ